ncbi:carnosine synthase 1-like [Mytilus californianus]|uniref:carnosine synthase 1-like n=1 Tax=Mytilus californianus TaxID=6549 RepID=UPI002246E52C|nr:carnosine synthase 1-like [Mytilus californianus]
MANTEQKLVQNDDSKRCNTEELSGKTILIIGTSGPGLQFLWKILKDLNIKVILFDPKEENHGRRFVEVFIQYNYLEDSIHRDENHANTIIRLLGHRKEQLSACISFDEDSMHLTAILSQKLGLIGIDPDVARTSQSKQLTYDALKDDLDTSKYSPLSFRIENVSDIVNTKGLLFPAILKPEYGSNSEGITEVTSTDDCASKYTKLQGAFGKDWNVKGFGSAMVLMEYLPGISHHIEIVVFHGALLKALVSDMGPKLPGVFADTTTCFPTCLSDKLKGEIINASFDCCRKIGLDNGVYNVEMKLTNTGFKMVEINTRPGSYKRCAVFKTTNSIDLHVTNVLIKCGIKPKLQEVNMNYAVGCFLYSFAHRRQLRNQTVQRRISKLQQQNQILYIERSEIAECDNTFPKCFAHLVAMDKRSVQFAKQNLIDICTELNLSSDEYNIKHFTRYF